MEQDPSSDRIRELLSRNIPLHVVRKEPLTPGERKQLYASGFRQVVLYILMGACIVGVPFLATEEELSMNSRYLIASGLFVSYTTLLVLLVIRMRQAYAKPKQVITGFITAKSRQPMKRGYAHFITLGKDRVIQVDTGSFHRYQLGDAVECHMFSGWGTVVFSHRLVDFQLPDPA